MIPRLSRSLVPVIDALTAQEYLSRHWRRETHCWCDPEWDRSDGTEAWIVAGSRRVAAPLEVVPFG